MKQSKQINSNSTSLVRIDAGWHLYAKLEAVKRRRTVKSLVEEGLELVIGDYSSLSEGRGSRR